MKKLLVPYDGSENASRALQYAVELARAIPGVALEILNVQDPVVLRSHAGSEAHIRHLQDDEGQRLCKPASELLQDAGVPHRLSTRVGSPANQIAEHLHATGCDAIIMGTRGMGPVASLMIGSVATRVIGLVDVPVTLVK
jgi:nucleotide-binding universal stress UspA family protein